MAAAEEAKIAEETKVAEQEEKSADNGEQTAADGEKPADDVEMKDDGEKEPAEDTKLKPAEKPKELEEDAADDSRAKLEARDVRFNTEDTTLNVMQIADGKLLSCLSDGGCQYLLAGARSSAGVKAGRYMFEVKIIEKKNPQESKNQQIQGPTPKQLVRVGFCTGDATLFLPDAGVCFDSEGKFLREKERLKVGKMFAPGHVAAVVLNLDPQSPNADTISLFVNGIRASQPQALPESLKGKTLFPIVTYRNVLMQVHFGPQPWMPLPFKCRSVLDAAKADCETKVAAAPADGKHEVIFPIAMPDEGTFTWLDSFLAKNKNYTELSDRMIVDWALKSGIQRSKGSALKPSHDKPDMESGLPMLDDMSVRRTIKALAPAVDRNYVVMEVKKNLLPEERKKALAMFPSHSFKRICQVRMGEPDDEFKAAVQDSILTGKKAKAEAEAKRKRQERDRKKAEELRKKKAEAAKKAREEAAKRAKEARLAKAKGEEVSKEEVKDDKMDVDEKEEEPEEEIVAEEVSLTEEDKKVLFIKKNIPDIVPQEVSSSFSKFALPSTEEGFDRIDFPWQSEEQCKDHLRSWTLAKKLTERVETLKPSEWFKGKWDEWTKTVIAWKKKQQEFKDPVARKKAAAAKKKAEEDKKKKEAEEKNDDEKKEGEAEEAPAKEETEEKMEINMEDLDVFSVDDVTDCGNGEPLFSNFAYEDWTLLSLRFEFHLLLHAFRRDLDDSDRPSFGENHLEFYYNKYYKKQFSVKNYGSNCKKLEDVVDMMKDTVGINKTSSLLETQLTDDTPMENFVKLTEDHRRDRARRAEAGDETAELKFPRSAPSNIRPSNSSSQGGSYGSSNAVKRPQSSSYNEPSKYARYDNRAPPPRSDRYGGDRYGGRHERRW